MEIMAIPAIAIICGMIGQLYKSVADERSWKYIPELVGILGMIIGVLSFIFVPGWIPAENIVVAAAIGAVSGGASTWAHQLKTQKE